MTFRLKDLPQKRLTEHMSLHLVTELFAVPLRDKSNDIVA